MSNIEFAEVVLLDFFSDIHPSEQKPFQHMWQKRESVAKVYSYPQLEAQFKLLYTAITRCCNRLVFVETAFSKSADSFFRGALLVNEGGSALVETMNLHLLRESKADFMTADEWRVRGLDFALAAAGVDTESLLTRALSCFEHAMDDSLKRRTLQHMALERWREDLLNSMVVFAKREPLLGLVDLLRLSGLLMESLKVGLKEQVLELCDVLCDPAGLYLDETMLKHFRTEVEAHIRNGSCPTGVCQLKEEFEKA